MIVVFVCLIVFKDNPILLTDIQAVYIEAFIYIGDVVRHFNLMFCNEIVRIASVVIIQ